MAHANVQRAQLLPHPSTASEVVRSLSALVDIRKGGQLTLQYQMDADMSRVVLPARAAGERADGLWKHTCFEAFIKRRLPAAGPYLELNFSPAPQWAAYDFSAYRSGMTPAALAGPPNICARASARQLLLEASLQLPETLQSADRLCVALSAVIEEDNGRLCYWAGRHAPDKPDFHHPDGFILELQS